jgi:sirohydrochlorin cobaltochelatase
MSRALVLVGHGSTRNPGTRKPICAMVNEIRRRGLFDEVRCGLWKEEPHVSITLDRVVSDDIIVVPFFIADGYYTRDKIPEAMGLSGSVTERAGRRIRYTRAVGSHPRFAELIWKHAQDAGLGPDDALVVLGHGTPRNPDSGTNVFLQAERIRRAHPGQEILSLFIDQSPGLLEVWERTTARRIVVVPLFIADGWHVTETIPEDLGLAEGRLDKAGRELLYTPAVGTDPGLVDVVLALAEEAFRAEVTQLVQSHKGG